MVPCRLLEVDGQVEGSSLRGFSAHWAGFETLKLFLGTCVRFQGSFSPVTTGQCVSLRMLESVNSSLRPCQNVSLDAADLKTLEQKHCPSFLPVRPATNRAHLRSHSGSNAGTALAHAPTSPECTIPPHLFRVIVLERLQLPLPVAEVQRSPARHERPCARRRQQAHQNSGPGLAMLRRGSTRCGCHVAGGFVQCRRAPSTRG